MGWGEEKAKRGQGKWASSQATDQALDLLPPLFQLACRLHATSLSFSSELVRGALIHAYANSEAEGRENQRGRQFSARAFLRGYGKGVETDTLHVTFNSHMVFRLTLDA